MLMCSDAIVNPRENGEDFTKYSFPSKNMEALSSGIPLIAYKLDGIPNEYDQYINYPQSESIEDLAQMIHDVCEDRTSYYERKATSAQEWIIAAKSPEKQTGKIIKLWQDG